MKDQEDGNPVKITLTLNRARLIVMTGDARYPLVEGDAMSTRLTLNSEVGTHEHCGDPLRYRHASPGLAVLFCAGCGLRTIEFPIQHTYAGLERYFEVALSPMGTIGRAR